MWVDSMGTGKTHPEHLTHLLVIHKLFYQEGKVFFFTMEENVHLSKMTNFTGLRTAQEL